MTEQLLPFDSVTFSPELAQERKDDGLSKAILSSQDRRGLLEFCRAYARSYSRIHGQVSADDVRGYVLKVFPDKLTDYTKIAGHVFKGSDWEFQRYESSEVVSRHGNRNAIWKWKGNVECR